MASNSVPPRRLELNMNEIREQAGSVLQHLLADRLESERLLAERKREDPIRTVTGRSALDRAINSTQDMIQEMDHLMTGRSNGRAAAPNGTNLASTSRVPTSSP